MVLLCLIRSITILLFSIYKTPGFIKIFEIKRLYFSYLLNKPFIYYYFAKEIQIIKASENNERSK